MKLENLFERESELNAMVNTIKSKCSTYLTETNGNPPYKLYRGVWSQEPIVTKRVRLTDRRPTNTPLKIHELFNRQFTSKYGHPFRNGLFANPDRVSASGYGDGIYIIFPVGSYDYLWSSSVFDLYDTLDYDMNIMHQLANELNIHTRKQIDALIDSYRTTNLVDNTINEVMIWCSEYIGVRADLTNEQFFRMVYS